MRWIIALFFNAIFSATLSQQVLFTDRHEIPSSIRGLSIVNDQVAWFSGSQGYVGRTIDGGVTWNYKQIKSHETVDFRSLYAFDSLAAVVANAGSPAHILKTRDGGKSWQMVYENKHPDIFLDGMDFWDSKSGLIYGDPIDGKMMVLKTLDGGNNWTEIPRMQQPSLEKGEASFAASGTGIRCFNKSDVVITTGGLVSRIWKSGDIGEHWSFIPSPIIQGKNSTGIFSIGINKNVWITVGGDYVADSLTNKVAFYSMDEGRQWQSPEQTTGGYRSCIEFLNEQVCVAVGQGGLDWSNDFGNHWIPVSNEKGFHVVRKSRNGSKIFSAGNRNISLLEIRP